MDVGQPGRSQPQERIIVGVWPPGDGEMARRIAAYDWAATSLGPISLWPQSLLTAIELMLASRFPAALHVGNERIHLYNDSAARALGDWHPGALGRSSSKVFPAWAPIHERVWKGETVVDEGFMFSVTNDNEPRHRWYSRQYTPVRDERGRVIAAFVIGQDCTERKKVEAELSLAAQADAYRVRLSDALRAHTDPRDIQDTAARTLGEHLSAVRAHFAEIEGDVLVYEREYAPGMLSMLGRHPVPKTGQFDIDAYRAGKLVVCHDVKKRVRGPDELAPFEAISVRAFVGVPIVRDGEWVAVLAVHSAVPRAWRNDEVGLIAETAERTWNAIERESVAAALRDADRRKDEFIALLATELRNPLAPLRTGVEVIRLAPHDPVLIAETRELMQRQLDHMVRLVDDLLDVSRITSGKIVLRRQPTSLAELVQTALEANVPAMAEKKLELLTDIDAPVIVDVDPARIVQVLSNVLHNACKFTPSGGRVAVIAKAVGAEAVLRVRDTGVGIARELVPRVFELFTQGVRGPEQGGLGIGLALAKQLIEMHAGTIEVHSEGSGRGTEITIRLPFKSAAIAAEPLPVEPDKPVRNVVVIEDNRDGARAMSMLIRALGAVAHVAHDGTSGVELVRQVRPQVVLLDIGLPDVDGYEACRQIRAELGKSTRIIAVSGWGQSEDKRRAVEAGFDAHVTKPPDPSTLRRYLSLWP
jgi:signal transduction histidine kinase